MIALIWAQSRNGVIGRDGALPWHLPEDLAHFRALTTGSTVMMGRRTWESLPAKFRPLPGRRNVVLTHQASYDAPGAEVRTDLMEAVNGTDDDIWVIGGAAVYDAVLPYADRLVVTDVDFEVEGDAWAPQVGPEWIDAVREPASGWHTSATGLQFRWRDLRRANG